MAIPKRQILLCQSFRAAGDKKGICHKQSDGFLQYIEEEVRSWSYMKFPYIVELGKQKGMYRVGPLARVNNCDFIDMPLAEAARLEFKAFVSEGLVQSTLAYHWARMIEALYCAEGIQSLLNDNELLGSDLRTSGEFREQGVGVLEAPRGTLFHHYQMDAPAKKKK